jgi:hypothetical protein
MSGGAGISSGPFNFEAISLTRKTRGGLFSA